MPVDIRAFVESLQNNEVIEIADEGTGTTVSADKRPLSVLAEELNADSSRVSIIASDLLPGQRIFFSILENRYFPPALNKRNRLYQFFFVKWKYLDFVMATIPAEEKKRFLMAAELVKMTTLNIAEGVVTFTLPGQEDSFPVHPIYGMGFDKSVWFNPEFHKLRSLEDEALKVFFDTLTN